MEINKETPLSRWLDIEKISKTKTLDWDKFYKNLAINEIALQFYLDNKTNKKIPKKIIEKLRKDWNDFEKFLKGIDYFLELMEKQGFDHFIVIKLKKIPKAHTDMDILIKKEDFNGLKKILENDKFQIKDSIGYELSMKKNILGRDFVVDIHCDIAYNNSNFLDVNKIFKKTQRINYWGREINFCSDEDDFIITLVHSFFQKVAVRRTKGFNKFKWSEITFSDLYQLSQSSSKKGLDWDYIKKTSSDFGWEDALLYYLIALNIFFNNVGVDKVLGSFPNKKKIRKYKKEISSSTSFPIYTKISTTYGICLRKLKSEFSKGFINGLIYFYNMNKWFLSNGVRIIYHRIIK